MTRAPVDSVRAPRRDDNRLPWCTRNECPQYDGKRCRQTGFRPDSFCEPQLIDDYEAMRGKDVSAAGAEERVMARKYEQGDLVTWRDGTPCQVLKYVERDGKQVVLLKEQKLPYSAATKDGLFLTPEASIKEKTGHRHVVLVESSQYTPADVERYIAQHGPGRQR